MTSTRFLGALALLPLFASPAFAHQGVVHEGCPADQSFTAGDITVGGAFSREVLPGAEVGAGYATITNAGAAADRLMSAASETALTVELHNMTTEGGMMKMSQVEGGIEVPAGGSVQLAPGGLHIMFIGLLQPLLEGECVEVQLEFEQAGTLPIVLSVGPTGAAGPSEHTGH